MSSSIPTISEIRIEGFKSIAELARLEVRPLTILAGANSSGKSSAVQPLLLLKQTLSSPSTPDVLELAGPNVSFTEYAQLFFSGRPNGRNLRFGFRVELPFGHRDLDVHYALRGNDLMLSHQDISTGNRSVTLDSSLSSEELAAALPGVPNQIGPGKSIFLRAVGSRGFLSIVGTYEDSPPDFVDLHVSDPASQLRELLLNLVHLPGLRGNPQRDYSLRSTAGPRFDGHFQDYVAGIIAAWSEDEKKRLGDSLRKLGLTWKVEAKRLDATRVEVRVGRLLSPKKGGAKDLVSIADVGFGVSQVLPVLVALQVAQPGQLVYLEQPEIHLHPRAQRAMAGLLADAAARGGRFLVETHSSVLLRGIQTLVAEGTLDPALVKLHWFRRNESTGATDVISADLDADGAFGGDWPEDFDDTQLEAEQAYLDAVEARHAR